MRYLLSLMLVLLCGSISATAQSDSNNSTSVSQYRAPLLWDCVGPVKELNYKTEDPLTLSNTVKFKDNGQKKLSMLTYDDEGYPIGFNIALGKDRINLEIEYDSIRRPRTIAFSSNIVKDKETDFIFEKIYDGDTLTGMDVKKRSTLEPLSSFRYTNQEYDSLGNWISRDVVYKTESGDGKSYHETRTIKYYTPKQKKEK